MEHDLRAVGADLQQLDRTGAPDRKGLEGISELTRDDTHRRWQGLLKANAQIPHRWVGRIRTEIESSIRSELDIHFVRFRRSLRFFCRCGQGGEVVNALHQLRRQDKFSHMNPFSHESLTPHGPIVGITMTIGNLKLPRINRHLRPDFAVGVGGDGFLAAAELLPGLGLFRLLPLIHLHGALEFEGFGGDVENRIAYGFFRLSRAGEVNELAAILR